MGEFVSLSQITATIAPGLISTKNWSDASFMSLPLVYPSGAFVTVRLTYAPKGLIRVSDAGFAYRETESFGASRSFGNTARPVAEDYGLEVGRRELFIDVSLEGVERAIFDVSAASHLVAERIVSNAAREGEADISDSLHERLERIFPASVEHDGKITGASSTEWEVTALTRLDGRVAVFQVVPNYPVSVFRASTAFHDLAALEKPPSLVSVVSSKEAMGRNYSILAQAGRVIEIGQQDEAFRRAAA